MVYLGGDIGHNPIGRTSRDYPDAFSFLYAPVVEGYGDGSGVSC